MKKTLLIFLLLLSLSFAKYVELGEVNIVYEINRYGNVRVTEEITFLLQDCENDPFKEVYSERPPGLIIKNPSGFCSNTKCNFRYDTASNSFSGNNELVLELTDKRCGEIVTKFTYDVYPIIIAKDTVQFYYKLWGDTSPEANINVKIILPGQIYSEKFETELIEIETIDEETNETIITTEEMKINETIKNIQYYIHKNDQKYEVNEQNNIIEIYSEQDKKEILEINLLMPNEWFVENNNFIYRRDLSKQDIIEAEEKDQLYRNYKWILDLILLLLFFLYLLVPFFILAIIYYIYGKEYTPNEVNYNNLYEREIPSEHPPAESIYFIKGDEEYSEKEKGNAIVATMMNFVNKGIANIEEKNKDVYMEFNFDKIKKMKLEKYESALLDFIKDEYGKKKFNIKEFEKKSSGKVEYYQLINRFFMHVGKVNKNNKYVENQGNTLGSLSIGIYLLFTFFMIFFQPFALFGLIFGISALFIIGYKKIMLAKWTKEGRILNLKWENFRKYITDYSLMKEHPPESVKLWDEYLTYAIALGVADKTINAMKKIAPKQIKTNNHSVAHVYLTSAVALRMTQSFTPTYINRSSGSIGGYSGGAGGFGGGFGGGGFGGR
jgi:uncharacterized membrane protein